MLPLRTHNPAKTFLGKDDRCHESFLQFRALYKHQSEADSDISASQFHCLLKDDIPSASRPPQFQLEAGFFISIARRWRYPFVFVDTEFPGTIHRSEKPFFLLSPEERYALLKANVDDLRPIQVGITLCYTDADKSLVRLGTAAGAGDGDAGTSRFAFTWQFDLRDFDVRLHPHAPDSVALLESSGLDLSRTRRMGCPPRGSPACFWIQGSSAEDRRQTNDAALVGQNAGEAAADIERVLSVHKMLVWKRNLRCQVLDAEL
ncbi:hypothetical protein HPP92_025418 [Vanilla planifolia]|uniref:poly(A)-specific ribonuclease n=1 Tax=Vanilla planifolia TaxID=51239 RepID=A0A835PJ07_VANPL|nr:hypothetical protein HPP92_025418 [Vanilla planifolia]